MIFPPSEHDAQTAAPAAEDTPAATPPKRRPGIPARSTGTGSPPRKGPGKGKGGPTLKVVK